MSMKNKPIKKLPTNVACGNAIKVTFNRGQLVIGVHDRAGNNQKWFFARLGKPSLIEINKPHQVIPIETAAKQTERGTHLSASCQFVLREV